VEGKLKELVNAGNKENKTKWAQEWQKQGKKFIGVLDNLVHEEVIYSEAAARQKKVNKGKKETRLVNGAPELGRSERGAEAIAEARTLHELKRVISFC
jgi:hypothetical protein